MFFAQRFGCFEDKVIIVILCDVESNNSFCVILLHRSQVVVSKNATVLPSD